jgi:hypothetical protein
MRALRVARVFRITGHAAAVNRGLSDPLRVERLPVEHRSLVTRVGIESV